MIGILPGGCYEEVEIKQDSFSSIRLALFQLYDSLSHKNSLAAVAALVGLAIGYYYRTKSKHSKKGIPIGNLPGPKKTFLIGNLINFPTTAWCDTFNQWREELGKSIFFQGWD
jgi:hypothetical protein